MEEVAPLPQLCLEQLFQSDVFLSSLRQHRLSPLPAIDIIAHHLIMPTMEPAKHRMRHPTMPPPRHSNCNTQTRPIQINQTDGTGQAQRPSFFNWLRGPVTPISLKNSFKGWFDWKFPMPSSKSDIPTSSGKDLECGGNIRSLDGEDVTPKPATDPKAVHFEFGDRPPATEPGQKKPGRIKIMLRRFPKFEDSPRVGAWARVEWKNLLLLALMSTPPLFIYLFARPLTPKYFRLDDPRYAYPMRAEYIPTWMSGVIAFAVPFLFMGGIALFRIGRYWDANSAVSNCLHSSHCNGCQF